MPHTHTMCLYLNLQNGQNNGPYTAYTLYFGILGHLEVQVPGSQVAQNHRPLCPDAAHGSSKSAHNYRPPAYQGGFSIYLHHLEVCVRNLMPCSYVSYLRNVGVDNSHGPWYRPQNGRALMIRAPTKGNPNLWKQPSSSYKDQLQPAFCPPQAAF